MQNGTPTDKFSISAMDAKQIIFEMSEAKSKANLGATSRCFQNLFFYKVFLDKTTTAPEYTAQQLLEEKPSKANPNQARYARFFRDAPDLEKHHQIILGFIHKQNLSELTELKLEPKELEQLRVAFLYLADAGADVLFMSLINQLKLSSTQFQQLFNTFPQIGESSIFLMVASRFSLEYFKLLKEKGGLLHVSGGWIPEWIRTVPNPGTVTPFLEFMLHDYKNDSMFISKYLYRISFAMLDQPSNDPLVVKSRVAVITALLNMGADVVSRFGPPIHTCLNIFLTNNPELLDAMLTGLKTESHCKQLLKILDEQLEILKSSPLDSKLIRIDEYTDDSYKEKINKLLALREVVTNINQGFIQPATTACCCIQ